MRDPNLSPTDTRAQDVTVQGGDAFGRRDGAGRPQLAASQASVR